MDFLKLVISLYKCQSPDGTDHEAALKSGEGCGIDTTKPCPPTPAKPPLIKNVLGEELYTSISGFFKFKAAPENDPTSEQVIDNTARHVNSGLVDSCRHQLSSIEFILTPRTLVLYFLMLAVVLVLGIFVIRKISNLLHPTISRFRQLYSVEEMLRKLKLERKPIIPKDVKSSQSEPNVISGQSVIQTDKGSAIQTAAVQRYVKLYSMPTSNMNKNTCETDISAFLEETISKLISKLDRLLLKGMSSLDQTQSAISTPHLARRALSRRHRVGSTPSLQSTTLAEGEPVNTEKSASWEQLKLYSRTIGWQPARTVNVDVSNLSRSSQKLMHYFHRVCPVSSEIWKSATLIVNYTLYVMKLELDNMAHRCALPYGFSKFQATGPAKDGSKVSRVNSFDVLMHLQVPVRTQGVLHESDANIHIPPGSVLLKVDENDCKNVEKALVSSFTIDSEKYVCLSSKHVFKAAECLIDDCLQNLFGNNRSLMNRLPFQVKRASTAGLRLTIDTRALVGLGETEIKINIAIVLPLAVEGVFESPILYASPMTEDFECKFKPDNQHAVNPELLWRIKYDDFESAFDKGIERKMQHGSVNSSYFTCLMILEALLTGCSKNSLLDRGVLPGSHIKAVLNFLLLESVPEQWTYDRLSDRFSDIIHFIRESYANGRLPSFFMNNPHLVRQMPAVAGNKLLTRKQQQNILADMRQEGLDRCLDYLKDRLREVGLSDCVKEEYSTDMWEYEFFLFN